MNDEERAAEEYRWRFVPVVADYVWPPIAARDDFKRARIDDAGRPWIDDVRVNVKMHRQFMNEWAAWFDAHESEVAAEVSPTHQEPK